MRIALMLAGLMLSLAAAPQEIYRWVDKDGVVHYADQPGAPGAERVEIASPNVADAPAQDYDTGSGSDNQPPPASPYRSLAITQPAPDQVFFGADASVTVTAELIGELQYDHTLAIFLDGSRVRGESGGSAELTSLARGAHILHAAVLNQNGQPLISSKQVTFYVREPSINSPQSPQAPKPPPKPKPAS